MLQLSLEYVAPIELPCKLAYEKVMRFLQCEQNKKLAIILIDFPNFLEYIVAGPAPHSFFPSNNFIYIVNVLNCIYS